MEAARQPEKSTLEELCGGDSKLYDALTLTVLLNPHITIREGMDNFAAKAQEYEKMNDHVRARMSYHAAGEIALYEGKLDQARKFFKKAAEVDPGSPYQSVYEYYFDKENADKAFKAAQEFYAHGKKHLEETEH